jgi:hypothetical protein
MARATGPIYLLLGRRELMPDVAFVKPPGATPDDKNIFDRDTPQPANAYLQNFWITVGHQTGLVTVTENARNNGPVADPMYLNAARALATSAQSVGGQ